MEEELWKSQREGQPPIGITGGRLDTNIHGNVPSNIWGGEGTRTSMEINIPSAMTTPLPPPVNMPPINPSYQNFQSFGQLTPSKQALGGGGLLDALGNVPVLNIAVAVVSIGIGLYDYLKKK